MKRNPRKLGWTKSFRAAHGKEMVVDSTLTFAARRNVPTRYDRNLVAKTLEAMERVSEVKRRRERVFYKNRMKGNKERKRMEDRRLVAENAHLLAGETEEVVGELEEGMEEEQLVVRNADRVVGKEKIRKKQMMRRDGVVEEVMDVD